MLLLLLLFFFFRGGGGGGGGGGGNSHKLLFQCRSVISMLVKIALILLKLLLLYSSCKGVPLAYSVRNFELIFFYLVFYLNFLLSYFLLILHNFMIS